MGDITLTRTELADWPSRKRAHFLNTMSGFKPVHVMGTNNGQGLANLAIFSQVIHVGANPPLLGVLFRPATVPRHSLSNIRETGFFTLNHVSESFFRKAHQTAGKYELHESEFNEVGLTPKFYHSFKAPFVEESPVQIGLTLKEEITLTSNETILIVGEIQQVTLSEELIKADGYVDLASANIVSCTGMDAYHLPSKLARLSYAQPNVETTPLSNELF